MLIRRYFAPGDPPAPPAPPAPPGPPVPPAPPVSPAFFIKPDGTYVEKFWEHPAFPAELRDNVQIRTHAGVGDTLKNWCSQHKLMGYERIPVPASTSADDVWGQVADRLGRPKSAAEYKLPDPKAGGLDAKDLAPKEFIAGVCQDLYESEITQRQAERLLTRWNKRVAASLAATRAAQEAARLETLKPLRETWGANFDANRTRVESFLRARVPAARLEAVLGSGVLDEPGLLEPLHALAVELGEKQPDLQTVQPANVLAAAETEVQRLKADKSYLNEFDPQHAATVKRINELQQMVFEAKAGSGKR